MSDIQINGSDETVRWSIAGGAGSVGSLTGITLGGGADIVSLTGAVGGSNGVKLALGDGNNAVSLVDSKVNGATFGTGADQLFASIASGTIEMGDGNDTVSLTTVESGAQIRLGEGANSLVASLAGGTVTIEGGSGADNVSVTGAASGSYTIGLGDGSNTFVIDDAKGSAVKYTGGTGADEVSILGAAGLNVALDNGANVLVASVKSGEVTVNGGSGKDNVSIVGVAGSSGTAGTITLGDSADTLQGASLGAVTIDAGSGADSILLSNLTGTTITLGDGKDYVSLGSDSGVTIDATGGGNNTIILDGTSATVTAGDGSDTLTVASLIGGNIQLGGGKNVASIGQASGDAGVSFGEGADSLSIGGVADKTTITMGGGKDTVEIASLTSGSLTMGDSADYASLGAIGGTTINMGGGKDTLLVAGSFDKATVTGGAGATLVSLAGGTGASDNTVTLADFEYGSDTVLAANTNFTSASFFGDGTFSIDGGGKVQMNESAGYYYVTAGSSTDAVATYVWADNGGSNIDLSGISDTLAVFGTSNNESRGVDTILGSQGNDTIYAGVGDIVGGGAGNDSIVLDATVDGDANIVNYSSGKDTVTSFSTGFEDTNDTIVLASNVITDVTAVSTTASGAIFKVGSNVLTVNNSTLQSDVTVNVKMQDSQGSAYNVAVVNGTDSVTTLDSLAGIYLRAGNASTAKLDFSNVSDGLIIDLGNTGLYEDNTTFSGKFDKVTGGTETSILMGSAANKETLVAGGGTTTLWGGGSAGDVLNGDSKGQVSYFFNTGDGKDTITGAKLGTNDTDDVVYLLGGMQSVTKDSSKVVMTISDSDTLTIQNSDAITRLKFTTDRSTFYGAAIGKTSSSNNFNYTTDVQFYYGGSKSDTLTVGSDIDKATLWLAGSPSLLTNSVERIDASSSSGTLELVGSSASNETIVGGSGTNTLWGAEGNDTLTGNGTTSFYYGAADGNDVITSSSSDDKVVLYNISSNDLGADCMTVNGSTATFTQKSGSTLTIKNFNYSSAVTTFETTDAVWKYTSDGWSLQSMK